MMAKFMNLSILACVTKARLVFYELDFLPITTQANDSLGKRGVEAD
jgi:hypothetical protein